MKINLKQLYEKYITGYIPNISVEPIQFVLNGLLFGNKDASKIDMTHLFDSKEWIDNKEFDLKILVNDVEVDVLDVVDSLEKRLVYYKETYRGYQKDFLQKNKPATHLATISEKVNESACHLKNINGNLKRNTGLMDNAKLAKVVSQLDFFDSRLKEIESAIARLEQNTQIIENNAVVSKKETV